MEIVPLETLTLEKFLALVQSWFRVRIDLARETSLQLMEAKGGMTTARDGRRYENFSLVFQGPRRDAMPQGMRTFEHEKLGRFDLFIVPIGRDAETFTYEAVFNRPAR